MPELRNIQGLTPEEMSRRATELSDIARSQQIGVKPQGLTPLGMTSFAEKTASTIPDSSLTSAQAKAFIGDTNKTVTDRQAQIQADIQASDQKLADLNRMLAQQSSNLIQNQIRAAEVAQKPLKEAFAITREQTETARKEQEASQKVAAFRMEQAGTPYAEAATTKRQRAYELQDKQRAMQENELLNQAWDSALRGEIQISQRLLGEAQTAMQERQRIRDDARAEQESLLKIQEYEDTRALKAQDRAMNTVQNLVNAGFLVDQLPQSFLDETDSQAGMPKGFSRQVFETSKSAQEAQALEDVEMRKTKEIENAGKLIDILNKIPQGQSVKVGDIEYVGLAGGNYTTGTEIDSDGTGTFWSFNKDTGEVKTTSLGQVGKSSENWETKFDDNGQPWRFNPKSGQMIPFSSSVTATEMQTLIPDGTTKNPFRPGSTETSCGELQNDANDPSVGKIWGDSLDQKLSVAKDKKWNVSLSEARVGDTVVSGGSWTGHVWRILDEKVDPNGKKQWLAFEANMVPPNGGAITSTRWVKADDPNNLAVARIPIRQELAIGTDAPTFGKKEEKKAGLEQASALRKEFIGLSEVKDFKIIRDNYSQIEEVAKAPSAAGDLSLIFSYMKMLDPSSVVRETEFANAQNAAGVPDRVRNLWNKALEGTRLGENQRKDFIGQAKNLYNSRLRQLKPTIKQYQELAQRQNISSEDVIFGIEYTPIEAISLEQTIPTKNKYGIEY